MSDVEKITFDNHYRRRATEAAKAWERRASESAKAREKQQRIRSWMAFMTCVSFMALGASISLCGVFAAMGDINRLTSCASAACISFIGGIIFAEKIER